MDTPPAPLSASCSLYCPEDADDATSWDLGGYNGGGGSTDEWTPSFFSITGGDISISYLLADEADHMPRSDYLSQKLSPSLDAAVRQDSINWILKAVVDFYHFRPVTAYLSINYLDRFLSANSLPTKVMKEQEGQRSLAGGWPMQLLAVACLSVATKMEETHVPLLLDFQILRPKYVFEPKTLCRMELLLMAALRWRMRAVTPFDFLPNFSAVAGVSVNGNVNPLLFSRATDLIVGTLRVVDFIGYRPSSIAAAAVLCAAAEIVDSSAALDDCLGCLSEWVSTVNQNRLFCFRITVGDSILPPLTSISYFGRQSVVGECRQLMEAYLIDTCSSSWRTGPAKPLLESPVPLSPAGVLDAVACASCDTQKSSAQEPPTEEDARPAEPPPFKRLRLADSQRTERVLLP
ncbi:Cyclin-D1-1 [Apostasia shenzhenica]|uniref:Cyclin-D1-1 n=1 Tax=Apostasia shenzhenica TaxID=1088818 RepID=A0A2I0A2M9_9ASPA|nr:Cyclin-D1-1 [Apostasia shenzhenica]